MASAISSTASPISLFRQLKQKPVELHTSSSLPITGRKTRGRRRYLHLCLASSSKPIIELEFLSPKPEEDGTYRKQSAVEGSGEKLLRDIMGDNKIELYGSYGKVMNCGGGGSCGTCIVQIIDGQDLLNERTDTEKRYLKKKPDSWRLACQTIVGNKENSGQVLVQRLPQWKK